MHALERHLASQAARLLHLGDVDLRHLAGPILLDQRYSVQAEIKALGQSPQTEYVWFETRAYDEGDKLVATMLMQGRSMKASSPAYQ